MSDSKTPAEAPPKHHTIGECMHFVAARELLARGTLAPDTVELLILTAPQPIGLVKVDSDRLGETLVSATFVGANAAFNGNWYTDSEKDAKSQGKNSAKMLEVGILDIAQQVKARVQKIWNERFGSQIKAPSILRH